MTLEAEREACGDLEEPTPDEVYSPDQLLRIIHSAEPEFDQTILTTFALTMVRHGEGWGFMWRDVDFESKEINVRRSWSGRYRAREKTASRSFGFRSQSTRFGRFGSPMTCAWL